MVNRIFLITLAVSLVQPQISTAAPMVLTQQSVAELVLKQGLRAKEIDLEFQRTRLDLAEAKTVYDWNLEVQSGYQFNKQTSLLNSFNATSTPEYRSYLTTASLSKTLAATGTTLTAVLERTTQEYEADTVVANAPLARQSLDRAGLLISQDLINNTFGRGSRAFVNAADLAFKAGEIARTDNLEQIVLDTISAFWDTYVAQENFKQAVNSRDRYKTLVNAVRRKSTLGYSNPGDLPQVQAEYEGQEQMVKQNSLDYLRKLETLKTMLNLPLGSEVKLEIATTIEPVPELPAKEIESRRRIRAQKLNVESAKERLTYTDSVSAPNLDFVGNVYTTGQGESTSDSYQELAEGNRPGYYAGLRLTYNFGSNIHEERRVAAKLAKELEEIRLNRATLETQDQEVQFERAVKSNFIIAQSAEKQRQFREKAQQDLNRSYNQGRTDIQALIIAMNAFFKSEVDYVRALGNYAISLNQRAANRDELIPDQEEAAR